jgi:hypothetical protein
LEPREAAALSTEADLAEADVIDVAPQQQTTEVEARAHVPMEEEVHDDVCLNTDGSLTGGPEDDPFREALDEEPLGEKSFPTSLPAARTADVEVAAEHTSQVAEENAGSDAEDAADLAEEAPLPHEAWMSRPAAERELWERVRPRPLRREAARLKQLRFPAAAINRLMRLHPDLQTKSSEAMEIVNLATVMMLQAMARASIRGRKASAQTIRFEDVRKLCLGKQELNFLLPVNSTLDSSALVARGEAEKDDHPGAVQAAGNHGATTPVGPGQSTLNASAFSRATASLQALPPEEVMATPAGPQEVTDADSAGEFTPEKAPATKKRKAPDSEKKATGKVPRRGAGRSKAARSSGPSGTAGISGSSGITNFFRRLDAAAC